MSKPTITEHLLSSPETADLHQRATQSQFLSTAGEGRLSLDQLSEWLSQDRLYLQAYARFIGGLLSRVQLPAEADPKGTTESLQWRILTLLHTCLTGMMRELQFFEKTAKTYGIDLAAVGPVPEGQNLTSKSAAFGPNKVTKDYIDLFDSFAAQSQEKPPKSLLDGLVVLYATEKAYLDSWTYAKQSSTANGDPGRDPDGGALRKEFIPNWTSEEFRAFVKEIQECLDAYAASQGEETQEVVAASSMALFKKVMVLEEHFWPMVV